MKILKGNNVFFTIIVFLIIQNYVSSELFFIIGLIHMIYYIVFKDRTKIFLPFREYKILIIFFVWGTILGLASFVNGDERTVTDFVRDVFYYLNPLVYIYIGALYAKKKVDIYKIFNAFIIAGAILSCIELINTYMNMSGLMASFSVETWRRSSGGGILVASLSLAIIFAGVIPKDKRLSKWIIWSSVCVMLLDFVITFSRTNLLVLVITYLILTLNKTNYKKVVKNLFIVIIGIIIVLFIMLKFIPAQITDAYINKLFNSINEISSNHEWKTVAEIQGNWRGYETYCAINNWKNSNLVDQLIGNGLGKRVNVGYYAYIFLHQVDSYGRPTDTIPVLHNGYATMLIKQGILGVIIYIIFYFGIITKGIKGIKKINNIESRILLIIGLILAIQTYFLNGLYKDYCFYPLIVLLGYSAFSIEYLRRKEKK